MNPIRNLFRAKVRTITTLLGIASGIAVFVAIASVAGEIHREAQHIISGYDAAIAIQSRNAATVMASRISPKEFEELDRMFGEELFPLVIGTLREEWNAYALIIGTSPRFAARLAWTDGRSARPGGAEIAAGALLAERLRLTPGSGLELGQKRFRVTGVYSVGSRFLDGGILTDLPIAQGLLLREGINLALLKVRDKEKIPSLIRQIEAHFPHLKALPSVELVGTIRLFQTVRTFASAMTVIALLGAVIAVTNTLLMAVSERTREIGILMAVGWRPARVLGMLLGEGVLLCLGGALVGNGMGLMLLRFLSGSRAVGFGWLPATLSAETVVWSLVLALFLALLSMIWPAAVIFRLNPAEALRHE